MTRPPYDILEAYFAPPTRGDDGLFEAARLAWRLHRLEHRRAKNISSSALPAVANGVQHFVQAREELDAGIAALGGVSAGRADETPTEPR